MNERYRLIRPLASGGMAELFLGVARGAEGFERTVAIKRILPHLAKEPDIARMFLAEARLATQLQHQNIATVFDVGEDASGLFLVMELVDGWDLGVLLRLAARQGRRFPPHLAAFITLQSLAGLHHAYRKTHEGRPVMVAHRDVSPSNILVSREGEVKVTDFGIARLSGASFTEPGLFRGKEAYSAPEVLQGAPATELSDQFSLGLVFHELLTGAHPFAGITASGSVAVAIVSREVPALPPGVPAPLADAVRRMLARAPEARFPSAQAVGGVLARWLSQSGEPTTADVLTTFLSTLAPPPTLQEQGEAAAPPAPEVPASSMSSFAVDMLMQEQEPSEMAGVEMSSSGRLIHRCARCLTPLSAPRAACSVCDSDLVLHAHAMASASGPMTGGVNRVPAVHPGQASVPSHGNGEGRRSMNAGTRSGDSSPGGVPQGPPGARTPPGVGALAGGAPQRPLPDSASQPAAGTLSLADSVESVGRRPSAPSVLRAGADALELEERAPRPAGDWEGSPQFAAPSRRWGRLVIALLGIGVAVGGSMWLWPQRNRISSRLKASLNQPVATPVLMLMSEPSGATVLVDDRPVGTTPLALDNLFPEGPVNVQVRLKGYRTWKGSFPGGEATQLEVKLHR
ncbi:putative serine/threonine protein kinase [Myxococcus stipitatus DSM 14675]|uniref:Putative serine/threonine protein kinase n=1 Tax=Myxococcus stipitatus (strain DSM 14675 / JCM 12634 / Mx s8) TaxID=1278073 RepID=L7U750_MYXSD|nr:serine/threonine-protein kinase [Myxococcus stipitatus]AGC43670.1 putative serine/threonine protein kinase [Myxococcus stipitatus DSM 14675]